MRRRGIRSRLARAAGVLAFTGMPAGLLARPAFGQLAGALAVGLMALLASGGATPAAAQDRSVVIEEMHVVYRVQTDGDVDVEERYRVRFNGSWNGLKRILELDLPNAYGYDQPAGFRLEATTNLDGEPRRNEVSSPGRASRDIRVYVPDANDRTAGVIIRYTLEDALAFFAPDEERGLPAMDELYWQVTGTEWEAPIREVTAEVRLPLSLAASQAAAYQGGTFSTDPAPVSIEGSLVRVGPVGPLDPGEGLTLGVGWPAGTVARDPARVIPWPEGTLEERAAPPQPGPLTYVPLLLPVLVFWLAYRAWDARGRDPKERSIVVRWDPPEELSPAEAGTLVDHTPHMHDIISTLVEMAVKGHVVIEERKKTGFLKLGDEYVFHQVKPRSEWDGLLPHQRLFLDGLFKHRSEGVGGILAEALGFDDDASDGGPPEAIASVKLSDLKNEFYKEIPDIKNAILDGLVRKGHYLRRPDKARTAWILGAGGMAALGFLGFNFATAAGRSPVLGVVLLVAGIVSAIILAVFGIIMPARTEKGARTREAALGFKEFLKKVESPRYRRMIQSPAQFEEYLPYAMAFQCQEEWARAFDDLLTEPPQWYYGHHGHFHASSFASDMGHMASTAGSTMSSSPGGSGSGGGGSVGGGGGGGGGGGF